MMGCSIVVSRWPRKVFAFSNLCIYSIFFQKKCFTGPVANGNDRCLQPVQVTLINDICLQPPDMTHCISYNVVQLYL